MPVLVGCKYDRFIEAPADEQQHMVHMARQFAQASSNKPPVPQPHRSPNPTGPPTPAQLGLIHQTLARRFPPQAISAPLIFCAPSVPINVVNIFKVILIQHAPTLAVRPILSSYSHGLGWLGCMRCAIVMGASELASSQAVALRSTDPMDDAGATLAARQGSLLSLRRAFLSHSFHMRDVRALMSSCWLRGVPPFSAPRCN